MFHNLLWLRSCSFRFCSRSSSGHTKTSAARATMSQLREFMFGIKWCWTSGKTGKAPKGWFFREIWGSYPLTPCHQFNRAVKTSCSEGLPYFLSGPGNDEINFSTQPNVRNGNNIYEKKTTSQTKESRYDCTFMLLSISSKKTNELAGVSERDFCARYPFFHLTGTISRFDSPEGKSTWHASRSEMKSELFGKIPRSRNVKKWVKQRYSQGKLIYEI